MLQLSLFYMCCMHVHICVLCVHILCVCCVCMYSVCVLCVRVLCVCVCMRVCVLCVSACAHVHVCLCLCVVPKEYLAYDVYFVCLRTSLHIVQQGTALNDKVVTKEFTYDYSYWSADSKDSHFVNQEQVSVHVTIMFYEEGRKAVNVCL